jgi:hypothetical protein
VNFRTPLVVPLVAILLASPTIAYANGWNGHGNAYTTNTGVGWHYSARERAFFSTPASLPTQAKGPEMEWSYVPSCDGNTPGGRNAMCLASVCTAAGAEPGVSFWLFSRPAGSGGSSWTLEGTRCLPGERRVDMDDLAARVRAIIEDKFREIAEPRVTIAPESGGLVNLPVLAWTEDPGVVVLDIDNPLPGRITATPSFTWTWSDGTVSTGPGQPYSPAVSPSEAPDHYVHAVFDNRGEGAVTLTVTWTGEVSVPGLASIDIDPLVYTAPASFPVREARAELVDAYG